MWTGLPAPRKAGPRPGRRGWCRWASTEAQAPLIGTEEEEEPNVPAAWALLRPEPGPGAWNTDRALLLRSWSRLQRGGGGACSPAVCPGHAHQTLAARRAVSGRLPRGTGRAVGEGLLAAPRRPPRGPRGTDTPPRWPWLQLRPWPTWPVSGHHSSTLPLKQSAHMVSLHREPTP